MEGIRGDKYEGILQLGQHIHSILYGGRDGIITNIFGEQRPDTIKNIGGIVVTGGNATIWVVFEDGYLSKVPEGIVRGVQWCIKDEVASIDEIGNALQLAETVKIRREKERQTKEDDHKARRAALPGQYPYLVPFSEAKQMSGHALGAKNIRIQLQKHFPEVKFSIKSKRFAGGDSISVSWTDGPTHDEVAAITGKYEEGHFNGMNDCYEYNQDEVFSDVFGGAKYVHSRREVSDNLLIQAAGEMGYKDAVPDDRGGFVGIDWNMSQSILDLAHRTSCFHASARQHLRSSKRMVAAIR